MKKSDFNRMVNTITADAVKSTEGKTMENVRIWFGQRLPNLFCYGATSERAFERYLEDVNRKRVTTFMNDLCIGEWVEGVKGVLYTVKNACKNYINHKEYIAEFLACINMKSWEHYERGNMEWSRLYSLLYGDVKHAVFEYYENDAETTKYIYEYLD